MKRFIFTALIVATLAAGGCQSTNEPSQKTQNNSIAGLKTFETCSDLGDFLKSHVGTKKAPANTMMGAPEAAPDGKGGAASAMPVATVTVEEADLVKQEGNRLYVVNSGDLLIYDLTDAAHPQRIGRQTLSFHPTQLYAEGTEVALLGETNFAVPMGMGSSGAAVWYQPKTKVMILETTNAASPAILKDLDLDGNYVDSRKIGSAIYIALQSWMGGDPVVMKQQVEAKNPCDHIYVPEDLDNGSYDSLASWDVIGINLKAPEAEPKKTSLIGAYASTVYATPTHFYVTNFSYKDNTTEVYLLALDPVSADVAPQADATIPGTIVNQFSMDETDGVFRIASTERTEPMWFAEAGTANTAAPAPALPPQNNAKNFLTTFRVSDASMKQLGQIDSIVPGETITAARFAGPRAFVTTFVYTDPLVAIDLSDPTAPAVVGELHLPGSTGYLQVWGDRLIAIGSQNAFWGNVILNLFDVSDLKNPKLVEQETIPDSYYSEAQFEHKAFAFFDDRAILAIPVETSAGSMMDLYHVDPASGFSLAGSINHNSLIPSATMGTSGYSPAMRRALENGAYLYTVSDAGLKVDAFEDLKTDLFGELFPGFSPPVGGCGCAGDVCMACPQPL